MTAIKAPARRAATLSRPELPDPPDVEGWVKKAFALSPEIASLKAQRDAAVQEVEKARAGHLPTLDLVMQHQNSRSESTITPQLMFTNRTLGLVLNVPIYSGGQVNSATRQAAAQVERLDELLAALRQDLSVRVHKEFRGYTDGLSKVQALQTALRSAEVALDSARKSLEAGVRTTVDVLNAEQQRQQVLRDLAQARYETLLSLVRMESLTGNVDHGVLAKLDAALIR